MLGLSNPIHIAFLLMIVLLVFGAKRLPEMGRSLGSGMRGFKESISGEDSPSTLTAAVHAEPTGETDASPAGHTPPVAPVPAPAQSPVDDASGHRA